MSISVSRDEVVLVIRDRLEMYHRLRDELSQSLDPSVGDLYLKVDALYRAIVLIAEDHDILPDGSLRQ